MRWFPKIKIGKISLWLGLSGLLTIILLNVITEMAYCGICPEGYRKEGGACNPECYYSTPACLAPSVEPTCTMNLADNNLWRTFQIILGFIALAGIVGSGIMSWISILKYRERAILIFVPALLGILGLMFVLGEIFIPH
jgi:hypothetical protein